MAFAEIMEGMAGGGSKGSNLKPIAGERLGKIRAGFAHIDGLKAGDKVMYKGKEYVYTRFPSLGEVVEVFSVFPAMNHNPKGASNHVLDLDDFSVAYEAPDGEIQLFTYDSRHFERVE